MIRETTAMTMRNNLGECLSEVQYGHDTIVVTKAGKKIAALVNIDLFNKIRLMEKEFTFLTDSLAKACRRNEQEEVEKEIQEAVRIFRNK